MPRKLSVARAVRGIIGIEISEDEALNLVAQLDASISGSGREQQEREAHNVTATVGYIADFVQKQSDARLTEALVLRFHRMLTYSVPYRHNISGRYRPRRRRRLLPAPARRRPSAAPDDRVRAAGSTRGRPPAATPSSRPSSPTVASATVFWGPLPPRGQAQAVIPRWKMSKLGRPVFGAHEQIFSIVVVVAHSRIARTIRKRPRPGRSHDSWRHPPADDHNQEYRR